MACTVLIGPCPDPAALGPVWRDLEGRADASVFLSWAWMGTLVGLCAKRLLLARVEQGGRLVGLAVLGRSGRGLHLNESGDAVIDGVMIEYNGLLCARGAEESAARALLAALGRGEWSGREIFLSGVPACWQDWAKDAGLAVDLLRHPQGAPLAVISGPAGADALDGLSRNARQQIRRSIRYFTDRGTVDLTAAADIREALDWFGAMERLHTAAWTARGKPGAFGDPAFARFHRQLIEGHFDQGLVEILRLRAGDTVFGYLYNLVWRGVAHSYQSGFRYEADSHCRPGLVAHALALGRYKGTGMQAYRFLAGDSRYKRSLSGDADTLYWMVAYRPGPVRTVRRTLARGFGLIRRLTARFGSVS